MADIEYTLEDLKDFMSLGNPWAEEMYKEKKAYLDSLKKTKSKKLSKEEKKYKEILDNPKISSKAKKSLKRNTNNGTKLNMQDLLALEQTELMMGENWDSEEEEKPKKRGRPKKTRSPSPTSVAHNLEKPKKTYKQSNLMKGRSDLKKVGEKYAVETDMKVRKGLEPKVKRALEKSIIQEAKEQIKGSGIRHKIELDLESSSEEEKPKRRGRPKKGKGYESESSSDEEDLKEYSKLLKHFVNHIIDKKEKLDPNDIKQAKEILDIMRRKRL